MTARGGRTVAFVLVMAALGAYAVARVRVEADFSAFLPAGATSQQRALIRELREGAAGRLLLVELSGAAAPVLAQESRALVAALAVDPHFAYVANGDPAQALQDFTFVLEHRYALAADLSPERFTTAALHDALMAALEQLYGSAAPLAKDTIVRDPTGETLRIVRALLPAQAPRSVDGVWFDAQGRNALLVAATRAPASDLAAQAQALAALDRLHAKVDPGRAAALSYSSPGALAVASRQIIATQAETLSLVSTALILAVLGWAYRAVRPVLLCALPAAAGLLAGICAVHAGLGRLNGITLAFGTTLLGEAVDYPSFLFTQLRGNETATVARRRLLPLLRLAVLTTCCSALALLLSGFRGLMELGVLTLVGILAAGIVTVTVVADWAPAGLGRRMPEVRAHPLPMAWSIGVRWAIAAGVLAACVLGAAALARPVFDDDLAHLNPLPTALAAHDRSLREALHAPDVRSVVLVRAGDVEAVLQATERLRPTLAAAVAAGELGGFDLASDVLPSAAAQQRRRTALPDAAMLHARLAEALQGSPFRPDAFAPFEHDVAAARAAPILRRGDLGSTALGLRADTLLGRDADGAYAVVPLRDLTAPAALAARLEALHDPAVSWLDLRRESAALLRAYRQRALAAIAGGAALIVVVLAAGLRDARRALGIAAPVLGAVVLDAALLVLAGVPLTIFHLVALLLVVGIGVNYGLFIERNRGSQERNRTARTLLVVSGTTLCAFATLAASAIPVLRALGLTVTMGALLCLLLLVFLHAPSAQRAAA